MINDNNITRNIDAYPVFQYIWQRCTKESVKRQLQVWTNAQYAKRASYYEKNKPNPHSLMDEFTLLIRHWKLLSLLPSSSIMNDDSNWSSSSFNNEAKFRCHWMSTLHLLAESRGASVSNNGMSKSLLLPTSTTDMRGTHYPIQLGVSPITPLPRLRHFGDTAHSIASMSLQTSRDET